jgi:hypothetical protein
MPSATVFTSVWVFHVIVRKSKKLKYLRLLVGAERGNSSFPVVTYKLALALNQAHSQGRARGCNALTTYKSGCTH